MRHFTNRRAHAECQNYLPLPERFLPNDQENAPKHVDNQDMHSAFETVRLLRASFIVRLANAAQRCCTSLPRGLCRRAAHRRSKRTLVRAVETSVSASGHALARKYIKMTRNKKTHQPKFEIGRERGVQRNCSSSCRVLLGSTTGSNPQKYTQSVSHKYNGTLTRVVRRAATFMVPRAT